MVGGLGSQVSADSRVNLEYCLVSVSHKIHSVVADRQDELHGRQLSYEVGDPEMAKLEWPLEATFRQDLPPSQVLRRRRARALTERGGRPGTRSFRPRCTEGSGSAPTSGGSPSRPCCWVPARRGPPRNRTSVWDGREGRGFTRRRSCGSRVVLTRFSCTRSAGVSASAGDLVQMWRAPNRCGPRFAREGAERRLIVVER